MSDTTFSINGANAPANSVGNTRRETLSFAERYQQDFGQPLPNQSCITAAADWLTSHQFAVTNDAILAEWIPAVLARGMSSSDAQSIPTLLDALYDRNEASRLALHNEERGGVWLHYQTRLTSAKNEYPPGSIDGSQAVQEELEYLREPDVAKLIRRRHRIRPIRAYPDVIKKSLSDLKAALAHTARPVVHDTPANREIVRRHLLSAMREAGSSSSVDDIVQMIIDVGHCLTVDEYRDIAERMPGAYESDDESDSESCLHAQNGEPCCQERLSRLSASQT